MWEVVGFVIIGILRTLDMRRILRTSLLLSTAIVLFTCNSFAQEIRDGGAESRANAQAEESLTPAQKLNRDALEAMGSKEWKKTFTLLSAALKEDPAEVQTYLNFGVAHYIRKEYPSCEHALLKAMEVDPTNAKAHYLYSKVIIFKGERDLAVSSAKKAFELSDETEWTYMDWLAGLYKKEERYTDAVDCYSIALDILETDLDVLKKAILQQESRDIITDTWTETEYVTINGRTTQQIE